MDSKVYEKIMNDRGLDPKHDYNVFEELWGIDSKRISHIVYARARMSDDEKLKLRLAFPEYNERFLYDGTGPRKRRQSAAATMNARQSEFEQHILRLVGVMKSEIQEAQLQIVYLREDLERLSKPQRTSGREE